MVLVKQEERKARTKAAIAVAARDKFGGVGFAGTSVDDIASQAQVAKGAVYHHFSTKKELFEYIFERVSSELAKSVADSGSPDQAPIERLLTATNAYFDLCADPPTLQITLRDGPSVLGFERWRELDTSHFGGLLTAGLNSAMKAGAIVHQPVKPLSNMLLAAIQAAVLDCALQNDFKRAASQYFETFSSLVANLAVKNDKPLRST